MKQKANTPKKSLRRLKLYLRESIKNCERDLSRREPYMADRIGYHIVKWSSKTYDSLILIYDRRIVSVENLSPTSIAARDRFEVHQPGIADPELIWVTTSSNHFKSDIWDALNKMVFKIRRAEKGE